MIATSLAILTIAAELDPRCQALIEANSQSLALIRTIDVHYTVTSPNTPHVELETWWSREGHRERIRSIRPRLEVRADGRPDGWVDLLIDAGSYKLLENWNPADPQKITPLEPGTVRAATGPQTGTNVIVQSPAFVLNFEIDFNPRRTLSELANLAPRAECKGTMEIDGRQLRLISLESPEEVTATTQKRYYDVYLDPSVGYLVRRVVVHERVLRSDGTVDAYSQVRDVVELKDFGDGIYVPTKIRQGRFENGNMTKLSGELVVKSVKVNEPIPEEMFHLEWPKYARVTYHPPVNGRFKVEIWGDGKPLKEISRPADIRALDAELRKDPAIAAELGPLPGVRPPVGMSTMLKLTIALAALVVFMVAVIFVRRIREQAA